MQGLFALQEILRVPLMGRASRCVTAIAMATALQKAVAMYFLLHDHAKGETDLTEDQLAAVVEGVCDEAATALAGARRAGLLAPAPDTPAHRRPVRAPHATVQ